MYVAMLEQGIEGFPPIPYFLSATAFHTLEQFVQVPETHRSQLLLVSGTIKSGKSTLVKSIIPGMVLAAARAAEPRPVFMHVTLGVRLPATDAAAQVVVSACSLANAFGIALPESLASYLVAPLRRMAEVVRALSLELRHRHCMLWLLFDELGAPFTASTPPDMRSFANQFKTVSGLLFTHAQMFAPYSYSPPLLIPLC